MGADRADKGAVLRARVEAAIDLRPLAGMVGVAAVMVDIGGNGAVAVLGSIASGLGVDALGWIVRLRVLVGLDALAGLLAVLVRLEGGVLAVVDPDLALIPAGWRLIDRMRVYRWDFERIW